MEKGRVVVLDNGGATCKIGFGGEAEPVKVIPNFVAKAKSLKRPFVADLVDTCPDIKGLGVLRPVDRGYVVNWDLQRTIWDRAFSGILKVQPSSTSLLVSEPLFSLPGIQRSMAELAFEHFAFRSYLPVPSPMLAYRHESSVLRDSPPAPPMPSLLATSSAVAASSAMALEAGCGVVVDAGFSFTHAVPIWNNRPLLQAVRRMNVGGKALTNVLKEAVSYRAWNMMDETLIMDHAKEQLCFVSLFPTRHLPLARKRDVSNIFRAEYLLPDGVTLLRGQVKDRTAAMQAVKAQEDLWEQHMAEEVEEVEEARGTRGRKRGGALLEGRTRRGSDGVGSGEEDREMGRKRERSGWEGERGDEEGGRRQQQGGRGGGGGVAGGDDDDEEDEEDDEDWDEKKGRGKAKGGATAAGSGGGNSGGAGAAGSGGGNSGGAGGGACVVMPPPANIRGAAGGGGPGSRTGGSSSEQPGALPLPLTRLNSLPPAGFPAFFLLAHHQELSLASERFMVPEGLFHPSDLGMGQAGLADTMVAAVSAAPRVIHPLLPSTPSAPLLLPGVSQAGLAESIVAAVTAAPRVIHPLLYSNIVLVGGSCQFPFFKERLALELRPLVPDSLPINISLSQSPVPSTRGYVAYPFPADSHARCMIP
ncbi:unnamed protein product [Closterium sp. Naga37s-1]|nr:unnamed protein product [Closterium sp. Naga37s-1]